MELRKNIRRGAYGLPIPDLSWIKSQGDLRRFILPFMHFGSRGFNWTDFNVTAFKRVIKYDNNSDGNPEYYKEISYLNLTQDKDKNGIYEIEIIKYHMKMYRDENSGGNPEYGKWIDAFYYAMDSNENSIYEENAVVGIKGVFYDNSSSGSIQYLHVKAARPVQECARGVGGVDN